MIYCDTWALIYKIQIAKLLNSISYSIAYKFKEKNGFGIDKACDSILMWHGDIVFKKGIPALRWQTVTKSEEVFD